MTNFVIKDDIFFTLEKSEGNMPFPRKYFARKVSGTEIKIRTVGSNEALLVDVWHLDNFTIDGVAYTDVHEAVTALQTILWNEAVSTPPLGEDCEAPVHTKDCDREELMAQLELQLAELVKIYGAVDGLELTTENIRIEAGQINLSTDEVEALLSQIKDLIALRGSDCANAVFTKDCDRQELLDKIGEVVTALNTNSQAEQVLLTSIDTKLEELVLIKDELVTANTTLTEIKTDTTATNTKLDTLITKATDQITELQGIKTEIVAGNLKLDVIVTKLTNIDTNINTIKDDVTLIKTSVESIDAKLDDVVTSLTNIETLITESNTLLTDILAELDIELIVNTFEKNNGTINYVQRDTILWDSENSTQISLTTEYSIDGINWTSTAPAGDVILGFKNSALILGEEVLNCGVKTDGTKSEYYIRQDYLGTEELPLKYSQNRIDWTEDAPVDTTFALGACPVEAITPVCIENVTYDLDGAKGIIFEANKLNSYDAQVYKGEMKYTEKNNVIYVEEGYNHSNGFTQDDRLLPNELKIVNKDANSRTIIKVLQVCGYMPIIADVIDETMVLLVSAEPKADNTAIDVIFTDVPPDGGAGATGYRIKRYVKGANVSTAVTLIDWTEGVANALITNNNNGTYTYKDATAVVAVNYMYFYEAYNAVSEGKSNELEASLYDTSFQPLMRTTLPNETVTLPMTVSSPVTIEWGDGTTTTQTAPFTKTYATAGDYHIKVKITASREVTNFRFVGGGDRLKLIDIKNWGWVRLQNGSNFSGCSNLEKITAKDTPTGLTNMGAFFQSCSKLNQIDNFNWDTSLVITMRLMFWGCTLFNQPVNQLNTSNVTNMESMFDNARGFNQPVNQLNTSKVITMEGMFAFAIAFNQPVLFTIPVLTTARNMFSSATAFSTTNMDNCLINFAGQTTQNNVNMANNRPRTSASNSAVATLQGRGWTGLV